MGCFVEKQASYWLQLHRLCPIDRSHPYLVFETWLITSFRFYLNFVSRSLRFARKGVDWNGLAGSAFWSHVLLSVVTVTELITWKIMSPPTKPRYLYGLNSVACAADPILQREFFGGLGLRRRLTIQRPRWKGRFKKNEKENNGNYWELLYSVTQIVFVWQNVRGLLWYSKQIDSRHNLPCIRHIHVVTKYFYFFKNNLNQLCFQYVLQLYMPICTSNFFLVNDFKIFNRLKHFQMLLILERIFVMLFCVIPALSTNYL